MSDSGATRFLDDQSRSVDQLTGVWYDVKIVKYVTYFRVLCIKFQQEKDDLEHLISH